VLLPCLHFRPENFSGNGWKSDKSDENIVKQAQWIPKRMIEQQMNNWKETKDRARWRTTIVVSRIESAVIMMCALPLRVSSLSQSLSSNDV